MPHTSSPGTPIEAMPRAPTLGERRRQAGIWTLPPVGVRTDRAVAPRSQVRSVGLAPLSPVAAEAGEVGGALFHEGVAAFHRFLRAVVEGERGQAEGANALDVIGVGVERGLGDLEGGRTLREQL